MVEDGLLLHLSKMPAFAVGRNLRLVRRDDALIITQSSKNRFLKRINYKITICVLLWNIFRLFTEVYYYIIIIDMEEINLRDLLIYFRKHLVLFFAMVVLCVSAGTAYTILVQKPEYKSRATIILSSDKSKTTVQNEITANKNLIDTYTEVVKSHRVLDRVISENNLADSFETLSTKISVSSLKNTEIISISVVDKEAYRSYEIANWVADIFKEEISQIYNDTSVNILDHAVEPKSPYNVDVVKQEIIYMVAGMVLGGGIILVLFYFDRTIKTTEQIEEIFKLPIFGKVHKLETDKQKKKRKKLEAKLAKLEAKRLKKEEKEQRKLEKQKQKEAEKEAELKAEAEKIAAEKAAEEAAAKEAEEAEKAKGTPERPFVEIKAVGRKIIAEEKAIQEKIALEQEKIAAEKEAEIANVEEVETVEVNEDSELVLRDNPKMAVAEDFRTIRTSLYFSLNNQNSNTVLFCSSRAHEGKSFIIANLAVAFAKTNKKVLLVDCDMRLGRQHEIFELSNQFGLSNILAEGDLKKLRQYALKTNVKNLEVITRGVVPPNPSELLESKKMEMLLAEVKKHYDYVLIDGTPIEGISDSLILAKRADRVILVCAANETTIEDLQNSKRALEAIEINMPGVILNQVVDKRRGGKNNYYNYYNN